MYEIGQWYHDPDRQVTKSNIGTDNVLGELGNNERKEEVEVKDENDGDSPFVVMYVEAKCPKCKKEPTYEAMSMGRIRLVFDCDCEGATDPFQPDQAALAFAKLKTFSKKE